MAGVPTSKGLVRTIRLAATGLFVVAFELAVATTASAAGLRADLSSDAGVSLLGAWTTHFTPNSMNGNGANIRRPAELIDGTVVPPGGLFNFARKIQPVTVANGYREGAAIIGGRLKPDGIIGGGMCSASTTMFNAALRAGFKLGARSNHAYYISRYPIGLDATIWMRNGGTANMTFTNDSRYPITIKGIGLRRSVRFEIWGVSDGRKAELAAPIVTNERQATDWYEFTNELGPRETERTQNAVDGFDAVVVRTVRGADHKVIHHDTIRSHYRRVNGTVLLGRCPTDPPAGTRIPFGPPPPLPR